MQRIEALQSGILKANVVNHKQISEEEFLLEDRLAKIRSILKQYGKDNFYISFSGGKDSVVLSALVKLAIEGDRELGTDDIPRVYVDTGIDLNIMRKFIYSLADKDKNIKIIKPSVPIKPMLEEQGYPFKSKRHARHLERYQRGGMMESVKSYLGMGDWGPMMCCPKSLEYQFTEDFKIKVSDKCCEEMKEKPLDNWGKDNGRPYTMIGIMPDEGGRRTKAVCLSFNGNKLRAFQPLVVCNKAWEDWFIKEYQVEICDIYKPPYNAKRTGCKGCPFALDLQRELDMLEMYFPNERKQCEILWKPIYKEYRRIGFRLKDENPGQITLFDLVKVA